MSVKNNNNWINEACVWHHAVFSFALQIWGQLASQFHPLDRFQRTWWASPPRGESSCVVKWQSHGHRWTVHLSYRHNNVILSNHVVLFHFWLVFLYQVKYATINLLSKYIVRNSFVNFLQKILPFQAEILDTYFYLSTTGLWCTCLKMLTLWLWGSVIRSKAERCWATSIDFWNLEESRGV